VPNPALIVTTYRPSGEIAIDIGKLFNRCGFPGTGSISCLLVGKSMLCAMFVCAPTTNKPPVIRINAEFRMAKQ
jgi:hypothetical protein